MARTLEMESVEILEDRTKLLMSGVEIKEKYLWCEPLITEDDLMEVLVFLDDILNIPYVVAKFDTIIFDDNETDLSKKVQSSKYRRATGVFVEEKHLFQSEDEDEKITPGV